MTDRDSRNGILRPTPRQSTARGVMKPGLTALGTAAVLGIYAAGFALTEDIAHGLDGLQPDPQRQTALADGPLDGAATAEPIAAEGMGPGSSARMLPVDGNASANAEPAPGESLDAVVGGPQESDAVSAARAAAPETTQSSGPGSIAPSASAASASASSGSASSASAGPMASTASAPSAGPTSPAPASTPASTPAPSASATAAAPAPESPYLDGLYTAKGIRTGHGDMEATVEIAGGRIASIVVSTCRMRWPCTDVDPMIPRMIRAQRPGVPIITGATQSSDSFSTAVTEALALARAAKTGETSTP